MEKECVLTIFTPAYNRAHTLSRTYQSLCGQTVKDFIWLIIDDGSSDNTSEKIQSFIQDNNDFPIIFCLSSSCIRCPFANCSI